MRGLYKTEISDARWWLYDVPGNAGWIIYFVCLAQLVKRGFGLFAAAALVPALLMLIGIAELISERIAKLDRILPGERLLRGFGALTLGGILGVVVSAVGWATGDCSGWMPAGSALCAVFAGLLYRGYRKVEE